MKKGVAVLFILILSFSFVSAGLLSDFLDFFRDLFKPSPDVGLSPSNYYNGLPVDFEPILGYTHNQHADGQTVVLWNAEGRLFRLLPNANSFQEATSQNKEDWGLRLDLGESIVDFEPIVGYSHTFNGVENEIVGLWDQYGNVKYRVKGDDFFSDFTYGEKSNVGLEGFNAILGYTNLLGGGERISLWDAEGNVKVSERGESVFRDYGGDERISQGLEGFNAVEGYYHPGLGTSFPDTIFLWNDEGVMLRWDWDSEKFIEFTPRGLVESVTPYGTPYGTGSVYPAPDAVYYDYDLDKIFAWFGGVAYESLDGIIFEEIIRVAPECIVATQDVDCDEGFVCENNVCVEVSIDWDEIRRRNVAQTNDEWGEPRLLSISSDGWEEGGYISPDGNELYFIYTNIDVFKLIFTGVQEETGPIRDNSNQCTHPQLPTPHTCGKWPRADHFYSQKINGEWTTPVPHSLTMTGPIGGITLVGNNKAYFMHGFQDGFNTIEDIGYAEKVNGVWGEKIKIESVSSLEFVDSDPFVAQDDTEMFFWSDRPASFEKKNIYRSVKVNGEWQAPELLPAPINSNGEDMQTFIYDGYLYFSSDQDEPDQKLKIWKSQRLGENEWATPELVIEGDIGVGEPSLTADGKYLYFEQIFTDGNGNYNPELMFVEREGVGTCNDNICTIPDGGSVTYNGFEVSGNIVGDSLQVILDLNGEVTGSLEVAREYTFEGGLIAKIVGISLGGANREREMVIEFSIIEKCTSDDECLSEEICTNNFCVLSCGDGIIQPEVGEICDGNNFGEKSCEFYGFDAGTPTCYESCGRISAVSCFNNPVCGDGLVEGEEVCDTNSIVPSCVVDGYGGLRLCNDQCSGFEEECTTALFCGDWNIDGDEECDDGNKVSGDGCSDVCQIEIVPVCGDGNIDSNEDCEGDNLDGESCVTQGFEGGTLACTSSCGFDTSSCEENKIPPYGENVKDLSKYSDKEVFLVSDNDWREVLTLVPVTTWTGSEDCVGNEGYGTAENVCVYPTLIWHDEEISYTDYLDELALDFEIINGRYLIDENILYAHGQEHGIYGIYFYDFQSKNQGLFFELNNLWLNNLFFSDGFLKWVLNDDQKLYLLNTNTKDLSSKDISSLINQETYNQFFMLNDYLLIIKDSEETSDFSEFLLVDYNTLESKKIFESYTDGDFFGSCDWDQNNLVCYDILNGKSTFLIYSFETENEKTIDVSSYWNANAFKFKISEGEIFYTVDSKDEEGHYLQNIYTWDIDSEEISLLIEEGGSILDLDDSSILLSKYLSGIGVKIYSYDRNSKEITFLTQAGGSYPSANLYGDGIFFQKEERLIYDPSYSILSRNPQEVSFNSFDADSIIHFMQQYDTERIKIAGETPQELDNLLIAEGDFGAGILEEDIYRIDINDYLEYWESFDTVVYVEDDYELGLMASTYASLLNAPLIIEGYNDGVDLESGKIICVGSLNVGCDESYSLEELQQKYVDETNTDKIILVNPNDLSVFSNGEFFPDKSTKELRKIYGKTSLASPILAGAKHEIILSTEETDYKIIDELLDLKREDYFDIYKEDYGESFCSFPECIDATIITNNQEGYLFEDSIEFKLDSEYNFVKSLYISQAGFVDCEVGEEISIDLYNNNNFIISETFSCSDYYSVFETWNSIRFQFDDPLYFNGGNLELRFEDQKLLLNKFDFRLEINYDSWESYYVCRDMSECVFNLPQSQIFDYSFINEGFQISLDNLKLGQDYFFEVDILNFKNMDSFEIYIGDSFLGSFNYYDPIVFSIDSSLILNGEVNVLVIPITYEWAEARFSFSIPSVTYYPTYVDDYPLTIMSSPNSIPMYKNSETDSCIYSGWGGGRPLRLELDSRVYGSLNNFKFVNFPVGRIMGVTSSDISSYLSRDLFFDRLPKNRDALLVVSEDAQDELYQLRAEIGWNICLEKHEELQTLCGDLSFEECSENYWEEVENNGCTPGDIIPAPGKDEEILERYARENFWTEEIKNEFDNEYFYSGTDYVGQNRESIYSLYESSFLKSFNDHGWSEGFVGMMDSNYLIQNNVYLDPSLVIGLACSTCNFQGSGREFCVQGIRRGALAQQGATDVSYWHQQFDNIFESIFLEDESIGMAILKGKNEDYEIGHFNFCSPEVEGDPYYALLGDPTWRPKWW